MAHSKEIGLSFCFTFKLYLNTCKSLIAPFETVFHIEKFYHSCTIKVIHCCMFHLKDMVYKVVLNKNPIRN